MKGIRTLGLIGLLALSGCKEDKPQEVVLREEALGKSMRVKVIQEVERTDNHDGRYRIEITGNNGYGPFTAGGLNQSTCRNGPVTVRWFDYSSEEGTGEDKEKNLCDYLPK